MPSNGYSMVASSSNSLAYSIFAVFIQNGKRVSQPSFAHPLLSSVAHMPCVPPFPEVWRIQRHNPKRLCLGTQPSQLQKRSYQVSFSSRKSMLAQSRWAGLYQITRSTCVICATHGLNCSQGSRARRYKVMRNPLLKEALPYRGRTRGGSPPFSICWEGKKLWGGWLCDPSH